jgi:hypothetical protein
VKFYYITSIEKKRIRKQSIEENEEKFKIDVMPLEDVRI